MIEKKVKEILEAWQDTGTDYVVSHSFDGVAHEICQLFKPDRPDRVKMTNWIYKALKEIEMEEGIKLSDRAFIAIHLAPKLQALYQDIEEAKRKERERIIGMMNMRDVGGVNPEWALSDKGYQALKEANRKEEF